MIQMKKTLVLALLVLLTGVLSFAADDYARVETFVGFNYSRINSSTDVPSFSANGAGGQVAINVNRVLGLVADIGAVHNGNIEQYKLDTTLTNVLFGPRFNIRKGRVIPYGQFLMGGVHASTSGQVAATLPSTVPPIVPGIPAPQPGAPVSLRASASQTAFAYVLGGGLDIKINKYVAFRAIDLGWFMTRLQNIRTQQDKNQDHIRVMTGLNFTFGGR
jgi:opacity protein-like surface antigen